MVGIVDLYKQLSSPLVRLLETRPGHALQFLLRFLAEFRPAAALGASFITMLLNFHNAFEEVRGAMLLTNYSKKCVSTQTCEVDKLLDLSNPDGSWRVDVGSNPMIGPDVFIMTFVFVGLFTGLITILTLIPFLTFQTPAEFAEGELIDTALCFHINVFNQKKCISMIKNVLLFIIVVGDAVVIAVSPNPAFILQVQLIPLLVAYISILFMFPYAKYNQMSYDQFVSVFKEDGSLAKASEMTPDQICIKLLVHNSKQRVLDEVSRQAMDDLKSANGSWLTAAPSSTSAKVSTTQMAWSPNPAQVGPKQSAA